MSWLTCRFGGRRPARTANTRLQVQGLEGRTVPTVQFFGGNVLPHVEAQALFLGNEWSTVAADAAQTSTLNSFLNDITGGAYMDALTRAGYGVGRGTATAGAVDPANLTLGSTISDASIQATLSADIAGGKLQPVDANRFYVVYVEPNVAVNLGAGQGTTQQGILGYHGAFAGPNGQTVRYAVMAYPGGSARNSSLGTAAIDQLTAVASHELAEGVTDPDVNFARLGWYDQRLGEIGDITENNPNALVRLDGYLVQEVADQNDQLLSITPPSTTPPPTTPPPTTPGPATTTTHISAGPVVHNGPFRPATTTVTITVTAPNKATPSGWVALIYNGSVIGEGRVHTVNGVSTITFNVAMYGSGNFTFSAQYLGNSSFQPSMSNSVTVTV
jgi:hypothetical protein